MNIIILCLYWYYTLSLYLNTVLQIKRTNLFKKTMTKSKIVLKQVELLWII